MGQRGTGVVGDDSVHTKRPEAKQAHAPEILAIPAENLREDKKSSQYLPSWDFRLLVRRARPGSATCHRRSRGRAIALASSSHRRWKAGLALSPAPGSCRPPSAAQRAVGEPSFDQPCARNFVYSMHHGVHSHREQPAVSKYFIA
eukprot:scaffold23877_cov145-Isochrysis_galbana.AAC.1